MLFIGMFGAQLFALIFGSQWIVAGEYAQVLSIWLFFVFLISPLSTLLVTLEKQKESFYFNVVMLVSRVLALCLGYYIFNDAFKTIVLFTGVGLLSWIALMFYIFKLTNILLRELYFLVLVAIVVIIFLYISKVLLLGGIF